jgi:preprotein translocase subunit SecG
MLYGFLITTFTISCILLILLVLIQKGKGSMGIGSMGGGTQMLFGGSGGQDFFQKATWVLGAIFMGGSLVLGLMKSHYLHDLRYINVEQSSGQQKTAAEVLQEQSGPEKK